MIDLAELKRLAAVPGNYGYDTLGYWMAEHADEFIAVIEAHQADGTVNYRTLLKKYIARVINAESVDYIVDGEACAPLPTEFELYPEETAELLKLSDEVRTFF